MKGYHFILHDSTSLYGNEPAFDIGETRTINGSIKLCKRGYHGCFTPYDAFTNKHICGPIVEYCEFSEPEEKDKNKFVSRTKTVLAKANILSLIVQFAQECAERAQKYAADAADAADAATARYETAVSAVQYAAADTARYAAQYSADTARYAAQYSADTARYAAQYSAAVAAADAAAAFAAARYAVSAVSAAQHTTEIEWQRARFNELINTALGICFGGNKE